MVKFENIMQIEYSILIGLMIIFYTEISTGSLNNNGEFYQSNECDMCLRWTDWIGLGDSDELSNTPNTYDELVNLAKHAAGYYGIDICAVPVSSDCRIQVADQRFQNDMYLACPYERHDNGTDDGWAQMRFLCWDHTCPCLDWSDWYNYDGPRDNGDIEILGRTIPREDWPCPNGDGMLDVDCRTTDGRSMAETNNRMLQCDFEGFQCLNDLQDENCICQDFMVRFLCLKQSRAHVAPEHHDVHYTSVPKKIYGYGLYTSVSNGTTAASSSSPQLQTPTSTSSSEPEKTTSNKTSPPSFVAVANGTTKTTASSFQVGIIFPAPGVTPPEEELSNKTLSSDGPGHGQQSLPTYKSTTPETFLLDIRHRDIEKTKQNLSDVDEVKESSTPETLTLRQNEIVGGQESQLFNRQKIETLEIVDGTELIIEAVPSKAYKPSVGKTKTSTTTTTSAPPRKGLVEIDRGSPVPVTPRRPPSYYGYYGPEPPVYRRPQPQHVERRPWVQEELEFPPMEWSIWSGARPPYVQRSFKQPHDPHNYVARRYGAHYNPQTGEFARYGVSDSRSRYEHGRRWLYPANRRRHYYDGQLGNY